MTTLAGTHFHFTILLSLISDTKLMPLYTPSKSKIVCCEKKNNEINERFENLIIILILLIPNATCRIFLNAHARYHVSSYHVSNRYPCLNWWSRRKHTFQPVFNVCAAHTFFLFYTLMLNSEWENNFCTLICWNPLRSIEHSAHCRWNEKLLNADSKHSPQWNEILFLLS